MNDRLTRKDIEDMEREIEHRKVVVRKELLEHVKEARAQGDLSENFEYYAAKKAKNENESRIRFLERTIRTARIIEDELDGDQAGLNRTVTVKMLDDGTTEEYRIVTTMRGDSLKGRISIESPLGKALSGHRAGERVRVEVNKEISYEVEILRVEMTAEGGEEEIRRF
ncbi:MAG: transcription elongation factor GreA [Lachnospiraceae bacterium]|jgi:transcription elongation factor GreA|nr:transcription elongation factor GreA [Lachnospiraceae bacterium]